MSNVTFQSKPLHRVERTAEYQIYLAALEWDLEDPIVCATFGLDPDAIVLGGGLSNLAHLYGNVPKLWAPYIFTDRVGTRFLKNRHGDSSGVRGAAWL